jgi:hypothetical protein
LTNLLYLVAKKMLVNKYESRPMSLNIPMVSSIKRSSLSLEG